VVEHHLNPRTEDIWGDRTPYAAGESWPGRVDVELDAGVTADEVDRWVPSACLLCSNGCGLEIAVKDGSMVGVRGRADDRVNHGRLGPKGLYGWRGERVGRLTRPLVREGGDLVEASWDEAMGRIVDASRRLLDEKGPLSHACGHACSTGWTAPSRPGWWWWTRGVRRSPSGPTCTWPSVPARTSPW
jgi:anaerobic selenocysteine-containing dehydrogenase